METSDRYLTDDADSNRAAAKMDGNYPKEIIDVVCSSDLKSLLEAEISFRCMLLITASRTWPHSRTSDAHLGMYFGQATYLPIYRETLAIV